MQNLDGGNNDAFYFYSTSPEGEHFIESNQRKWISNMPKLLETSISNSFENTAYNECITIHIASVINVSLKLALAIRGSHQFKSFHKDYRSDTNLFGMSAWDEDMKHCIRVELELFLKCRA